MANARDLFHDISAWARSRLGGDQQQMQGLPTQEDWRMQQATMGMMYIPPNGNGNGNGIPLYNPVTGASTHPSRQGSHDFGGPPFGRLDQPGPIGGGPLPQPSTTQDANMDAIPTTYTRMQQEANFNAQNFGPQDFGGQATGPEAHSNFGNDPNSNFGNAQGNARNDNFDQGQGWGNNHYVPPQYPGPHPQDIPQFRPMGTLQDSIHMLVNTLGANMQLSLIHISEPTRPY